MPAKVDKFDEMAALAGDLKASDLKESEAEEEEEADAETREEEEEPLAKKPAGFQPGRPRVALAGPGALRAQAMRRPAAAIADGPSHPPHPNLLHLTVPVLLAAVPHLPYLH